MSERFWLMIKNLFRCWKKWSIQRKRYATAHVSSDTAMVLPKPHDKCNHVELILHCFGLCLRVHVFELCLISAD